MAIKSRKLYNAADINSYFRDGLVQYKGVFYYIADTHGDTLVLRQLNDDGDPVQVRFSDQEVKFPMPETGCYQIGTEVKVLNREPQRQFKKAFRIREMISEEAQHLGRGNYSRAEIVNSLFGKREFTFQEALGKILNAEALSHTINRDMFLCITECGKGVSLFHRTDVAHPVGCVVNVDGAYKIKLARSTFPLKALIEKVAEVIV